MDSKPHRLFVRVEGLFKKRDPRVEKIVYAFNGEIFYIFWIRHGNNGTASVFAVNKDGVSGIKLGDKAPIRLPFPNRIMSAWLSPKEFKQLQKIRADKLLSFLDRYATAIPP